MTRPFMPPHALQPAGSPSVVFLPALAVAYVATILAANWAISTVGLIPVWPGLLAPAGVLFAGLAFSLRDLLHGAPAGQRWWWIGGCIAAGTAVSVAVAEPRVALASGVAFAVSELADTAVYAPMRRRGRLPAVVLSNVAGLVLDSVLFLWLAFGSLTHLSGQLLGKGWITAATAAALGAIGWARSGRGRS